MALASPVPQHHCVGPGHLLQGSLCWAITAPRGVCALRGSCLVQNTLTPQVSSSWVAMGTLLPVHLPASSPVPMLGVCSPWGWRSGSPPAPSPPRQPSRSHPSRTPRWELAIKGTSVSAIPLPGQWLGAGAGCRGRRTVTKQMRQKPAIELEQLSPSLVSSPSPAHGPTAPHRLIGPVVLLKDVLYPVLTAVREHHDHLVAVGTRDVGLRGRETAPEAGPGTSGARRGAGCGQEGWPRPILFPGLFLLGEVAGVNGQEKGHCLLGNDVATAARHLIAPFIFILPLARCLAGSSPLCPALLTFNNPEGQWLQQNLSYSMPGRRMFPLALQRRTRSPLHAEAPGTGQQPGAWSSSITPSTHRCTLPSQARSPVPSSRSAAGRRRTQSQPCSRLCPWPPSPARPP